MSHAFVHDRIFHLGGAEAVFFDLIKEQLAKHHKPTDLPLDKGGTGGIGGPTIYTLFSDRTSITINNQDISIVTALPHRLNNLFVRGSKKGSKILDYRNLIVFYPLLTKLLRQNIQKQQPSNILISSFAAVKNVVPIGKVVQADVTLYLHSPMQYIRENYEEYVAKLAPRQLLIFKPLARRLRKRDSKPRRYDHIYTNSQYTKDCALKYYVGKHSIAPVAPYRIIVKYPHIHEKILSTPISPTIGDYYLYIGRLVNFVRETDLIIKLANEINIPLIVMGSGPDEDYLKTIAGDTITFIGQVTDIDEKIHIISQARGLINLTKESCGMGTMEALALGVPVLGYNEGATPELVDSQSGILANSKDMDHLIDTFREFHGKEWKREEIKESFLAKYENR